MIRVRKRYASTRSDASRPSVSASTFAAALTASFSSAISTSSLTPSLAAALASAAFATTFASALTAATIATEAAPDRSGQEHHLIVLDGAMTVHVDGISHELTAEDCLRFRMYDESRFETGPSRGARYLLIQV